MSDRAKLFRTGGSQAVRLPRKYRFDGQNKVLICREGKRVMLESTLWQPCALDCRVVHCSQLDRRSGPLLRP